MNDIFAEFEQRGDDNQKVIVKENPKVKRMAMLTQQRVSEATILQIFQISQNELDAIRATAEYQGYLGETTKDAVETPLETDITWDALESRALKVAMQGIDYANPDDALRIARTANNAKRRTREVPSFKEGGAGINIETINVAIPVHFAEQLKSVNPLAELENVMSQALEHKTINIAKPRSIEEMLTTGAKEEEDTKTVLDLI